MWRRCAANSASVRSSISSVRCPIPPAQNANCSATTTGVTHVAILENGRVTRRDIAPEDIGLPRATLSQLKGGDANGNAQAIRALLSGAKGAFRDVVVLNAAAALVVADKASDLKSGAELATEAIDSGRASEVLARVAAASQRASA
jgi:anthranilate phosphoribosyltransferase